MSARTPAARGPIENERNYERPQDAAVRATIEGRCPTARILLPDLAPAPSGETAEAQRSASATPFDQLCARLAQGGLVSIPKGMTYFVGERPSQSLFPSRPASSRRTQPDGEARTGASPSFPGT
jgi:hypothetical protein